MHTASQSFILNLTPQMIKHRQRVEDFVLCGSNSRHFCLSLKHGHGAARILKREQSRCLPTASVLSDTEISSARFEEFSVSTVDTDDVRELKISIEVSGNRTQRTFDDVFQKMVKAAQPIPGFRRVKGGEVFMWILNWHGLFIRLIALAKEKRTEQEVQKLFTFLA